MNIELISAEDMSNETHDIEEDIEDIEEDIEDIEEDIEDIEEDIKDIEEDIEEETKKRFKFVIEYFQKINPNPATELKHKNGYELLVATILSAQATDKRVNNITPALFKKYPTINKLSEATLDDVYEFINSINYANNKSNYLIRMANMIMTKYNGKIPEDIEELQNLPGVDRKTAHFIVATLFNKPVIAVDTHVLIVAERIGLTTDAKNPLESEEQLIRYTPKEIMPKISHWLILHGRYICTSRNPECKKCGIN